jgi:hypothetical protein
MTHQPDPREPDIATQARELLAVTQEPDDRTRPLLMAAAKERGARYWTEQDAERVIAALLARIDALTTGHRAAGVDVGEAIRPFREAVERASKYNNTSRGIGLKRATQFILDRHIHALVAALSTSGRGVDCAARRSSLPDPQDCDWPHCSCDPHAARVMEALHEEGWIKPPFAPPPVSPEADVVEREAGAKIIFEAMRVAADQSCTDKHPAWVEGGNSLMQDEARRAFYKLAALAPSPADAVEGKTLEILARDLEPYRGKTVGSIRIDMGEVQKILAVLDTRRTSQPERCRMCKGRGGVNEAQGDGCYVGLKCPICHGFGSEEIVDLISDAIDESMGPDWNSHVGAAAVADALTDAGFGKATLPTDQSVRASVIDGNPQTWSHRVVVAVKAELEPFKQRDIAEQMGVTEARISQIFCDCPNWTIGTIERLLMAAQAIRNLAKGDA